MVLSVQYAFFIIQVGEFMIYQNIIIQIQKLIDLNVIF